MHYITNLLSGLHVRKSGLFGGPAFSQSELFKFQKAMFGWKKADSLRKTFWNVNGVNINVKTNTSSM